MAKIILSFDKTVVREIDLVQDSTTIGRAPQNDLVIDDPAISAEHAIITKVCDGYYLEDLNSTNGTQINGQPIRKHFLQDADVIALAKYQLQYSSTGLAPTDVYGKGSVIPNQNLSRSLGKVRILEGTGNAKEITLLNPLTTIGRPGAYVAIIKQEAGAYLVTPVEGKDKPLINDCPMDADVKALRDGDSIKVEEIEMQFYFDAMNNKHFE